MNYVCRYLGGVVGLEDLNLSNFIFIYETMVQAVQSKVQYTDQLYNIYDTNCTKIRYTRICTYLQGR